MPYHMSASPSLVVLFVLPVLLVLIYHLVQKRQKQGTLSLHFPVILNLHPKLVSEV
jgi:hypothetical protein